MRRRALLGALVGVGSSLAGCLNTTSNTTPSDDFQQSSTGQYSPSATPTRGAEGSTITQSTADCEAQVPQESRVTSWTVEYGEGYGFELTATPDRISDSTSLMIELTNTGDRRRATGVKRKFDVEQRTEANSAGWRSIYYFSDNAEFKDDIVSHDPGDGFTWEFQPTVEGMRYDDAFRVCGSLSPGAYRFVYRGVGGDSEALAVRFAIGSGD